MNELLNTSLFGLLAENSPEVSTQEMKNAYGNFLKQVKAVSNSDDNANVFRTLNVTRIELASLELIYRYEQGKKCA